MERAVFEMRSIVAVSAVLIMVFASFGMASVATAAGDRDLTPVVEQGSTDRLGGGDWIAVRAGDARLGVVYGTVDHPNHLYVFAEYKRFLGGADVYDARDNYLRTVPLPVFTVFGQSFVRLFEFRDRNGDGLLDFNHYLNYRNDTLSDLPVKATNLTRAWTAMVPTVEPLGNTTWVNFTVSTGNVPYGVVWDPLPRRGTPSDGVLDRLAFTFHLKIDVRQVSGQVPWLKVTLDSTTDRSIPRIESLGTRAFSGDAVAMGAKYDHLIEGWDFAQPENLLALETRGFVGHYVPERIGELVHRAYHSEANGTSANGTHRLAANDTVASTPTRLTRDYVYFNDEWSRETDLVGRLVWQSDVLVDGANRTMQFQVQGAERFAMFHERVAFAGFAILGAFIYPAGAVIFHDPSLEAISDLWNLPTALNLTPFTVLAIQLVIAGFAVGAAVVLRTRGRRAS